MRGTKVKRLRREYRTKFSPWINARRTPPMTWRAFKRAAA